MNNNDLAKIILSGMWQLACMACWHQRANYERAEQCKKEFMELFDVIDQMENKEEE